jgi:hypothetical protein
MSYDLEIDVTISVTALTGSALGLNERDQVTWRAESENGFGPARTHDPGEASGPSRIRTCDAQIKSLPL